MRLTTPELLFIGCGGVLGALVAYLVTAGIMPSGGTFPPFVIVLLGLGLVEIVAGFALQRLPGTLVRMPSRIVAFLLGVGVLAAFAGLG